MKHSAGKVAVRDQKRDESLIADYVKHTMVNGKAVYKYKISKILGDYNISNARLYDILSFYNVPRRTN